MNLKTIRQITFSHATASRRWTNGFSRFAFFEGTAAKKIMSQTIGSAQVHVRLVFMGTKWLALEILWQLRFQVMCHNCQGISQQYDNAAVKPNSIIWRCQQMIFVLLRTVIEYKERQEILIYEAKISFWYKCTKWLIILI